MGNPVFANAREISSKAMQGLSICQFPDVCWTPPQTPATPMGVPIPYPNTGKAGDTVDGSRSVQIGSQEVMLKDRSYFKSSTGDEAGAAPKKGMVNSKTTGKVYFLSWSFDVHVESENVVRHLDMTTHNHGSRVQNGLAPQSHFAKMMRDAGTYDKCKKELHNEAEACKKEGIHPYGDKPACPPPLDASPQQANLPGMSAAQWAEGATKKAEASPCLKARRCILRPYEPKDPKGLTGCCPGQTPHHVPSKSSFFKKGFKQGKGEKFCNYDYTKAPCMCLEGASQWHGSHGDDHTAINYEGLNNREWRANSTYKLSDQVDMHAQLAEEQHGCSKDCIKAQLNAGLKSAGVPVDSDPKIKFSPAGRRPGAPRPKPGRTKGPPR